MKTNKYKIKIELTFYDEKELTHFEKQQRIDEISNYFAQANANPFIFKGNKPSVTLYPLQNESDFEDMDIKEEIERCKKYYDSIQK